MSSIGFAGLILMCILIKIANYMGLGSILQHDRHSLVQNLAKFKVRRKKHEFNYLRVITLYLVFYSRIQQ